MGIDNIKLSVVIPYYHTFDMTIKLLNELYTQKTNEVEVIVVDDGCHENRFNCFKDFDIVHLEKNSGVSKARNIGTEYARGKYVAYVDSDDLITMDYVERLIELINTHDEDVIVFNWLDINTNEVNRKPDNPAVWKAIYKKDIIPRFNEELKVREDYYWQEELKAKEPSIYYYDRVLYIYNSGREGSLWWNETHK